MESQSTNQNDHSAQDEAPNPKRQRILQKHPNQPRDEIFPTDPKSKRKFLPVWFDNFPWLEWDSEFNAAFCHPCRQVYSVDSLRSNKGDEAFITQGFKNWKKATEKFQNHETSHTHRSYMVKFTNTISGTSVVEKLIDQQTVNNKVAQECLIRIITSLRYLARQGLATRGHFDSESNFKQLLVLRASDSIELQKWLLRKTTWTSIEIKEGILDMMANHIVQLFAGQIRNCFYGLIADETSDIYQIEQLSICFRTVDNDLSPNERVFGFYALDKCDAVSIFSAIKDALLRLGISLSYCFGMTFDGASSFSGHINGVGARISELAPSALTTHCHMHCVNLAVQDVVKAVPLMRDFLHLVNDLITFLRHSPKRCAIVHKIALELDNPKTHIILLCITRFTVKYTALSGLYQQFEVILDALAVIETQATESQVKSITSGYLKRLVEFDICFGLCLSLKIFELTDTLSKHLQGKYISVGEGKSSVRFTISVLESMHCEEKFILLWTETENFLKQHGGEVAKLPRQIRRPSRFGITE